MTRRRRGTAPQRPARPVGADNDAGGHSLVNPLISLNTSLDPAPAFLPNIKSLRHLESAQNLGEGVLVHVRLRCNSASGPIMARRSGQEGGLTIPRKSLKTC